MIDVERRRGRLARGKGGCQLVDGGQGSTLIK